MQWPPDFAAEFYRRSELLKILLQDDELLAKMMDHYRSGWPGCVSFINDWCVTYDPRVAEPAPKLMPFMLFPRQEELIRFLWECYQDKEDGLIEKARDMGATWVCVCFSIWLFLFHSGSAIGWGSRLADLVDDLGNPDSIFEKMRIVLRNLPPFFLPEEFSIDEDAPYMKILDRKRNSNIAGETGDDIGRGGRSSIYFKDESAHYKRPEKIEAALGDNTDVQIDISSVNGTNNPFYRRRDAGEEWEPGKKMPKKRTRVFILDWSSHPGKTQEWYDLRRENAERNGQLHIFAQEVDRDYAGAVDRVIIPAAWAKSLIDAHIKLGIPQEGAKMAMQDVADGGGDKNALIMREGIVCFYADHWGGEAGEAAQYAIPECLENGVYELYYDSIGVGVGFRVEVQHMRESGTCPEDLRLYAWNAGAGVLDPDDPVIPGDSKSPTNKAQYGNLKAQSWFRVRSRAYKTHMAITKGRKYPAEELISISSKVKCLQQLVRELSQPVRKRNGEGKTIVDKLAEGQKSPNLADGFVAVYNPVRETSIFDVL